LPGRHSVWCCWPDELHQAGTWRKQCEVRSVSEVWEMFMFFFSVLSVVFYFLNVWFCPLYFIYCMITGIVDGNPCIIVKFSHL
jgi:phosphate starvation-inducible membrane PsiE